MGSSRFLTTFISVLAATLFFYSVSAGGALAVNSVLHSKSNFGSQTYIGALDVSNTKEEEAKERLNTEFAYLTENFQVDLVYQDATVDMPQEVVAFDLGETIELAETGYENKIKVSVSEASLGTFLNQQFSPVDFTEDEIAEIATGLEDEIGNGLMPNRIYITDYLSGVALSKKEVSTATINLSNVSQPFINAVQLLNGTEIAANSTFSMLAFVANNNLGLISNDELTVIASALYSNALQTNFSIDERYIGQMLNKDVPIGYEASINEQLGIDFTFTNVNKSSFTLNAEVVGSQLHISLNGLPLLYSYQIDIGSVELFKPRTIQEFSALIQKGKKEIKQIGLEGREVVVSRTIFDGNIELSHIVVSTDYYAPIHQVEVLPLKEDETDNIANEGNVNGESDTNIDSNNENGTADSDGNETENSGSSQTDGSDPTKNEPAEEDEILYDKGGNVIN